eukprot:1511323-Amphidinium_carterae.1
MQEAAPVDRAARGGAASSSSAPLVQSDAPVVRPGRQSVKSAREKLAGLRSRCSNTIDLACQLLADPDLTTTNRIVALVGNPQHEMYTDVTRKVRDPVAWRALQLDWCLRGYMSSIAATFGVVNEKASLQRLGLHYHD